MPKITKFPNYFLDDYVGEAPSFGTNKPDDTDKVIVWRRAMQARDFRNGIRYVEAEILSKDLAAFSVQDWLDHIKQINARVASAVCLYDMLGLVAGEYSSNRPALPGTDKASGQDYELPRLTFEFSNLNYQRLQKKYGKQKADAYKDFCQKNTVASEEFLGDTKVPHAKRIARQMSSDPLCMLYTSSLPAFRALREHPGLALYRETVVIGAHPNDIPPAMEFFAKNLVAMIKQQKDPVVIAAYIHQRLVEIHPFPNGNGRTARLLMNTLLMYYGIKPVVLNGPSTNPRRREYDKAVLHGFIEPARFEEYLTKNVELCKAKSDKPYAVENNKTEQYQTDLGMVLKIPELDDYVLDTELMANLGGAMANMLGFGSLFHVKSNDLPNVHALEEAESNKPNRYARLSLSSCIEEALSHAKRKNYPQTIYMCLLALQLDRESTNPHLDAENKGKLYYHAAVACYETQLAIRQANFYAKQAIQWLNNTDLTGFVTRAKEIAAATDRIIESIPSEAQIMRPAIVDQLNQIFGSIFFSRFIATTKLNWELTYQDKQITAELKGLKLKAKTDTKWYSAKLLQAGMAEKDVQITENHYKSYDIRLNNVQQLESKPEQEVQQQIGHSLAL